MGSNSPFRFRRSSEIFRLSALLVGITICIPLFATKGIFQGRVVEGTKHEAGKYIYIEGRPGSMRRVNIQNCRVRFDAGIPASQRVRSAAESLRESAQVRVTAEQRDSGEWVATDILILKLPEVDRVRLQT
jgi:hypothetical protein